MFEQTYVEREIMGDGVSWVQDGHGAVQRKNGRRFETHAERIRLVINVRSTLAAPEGTHAHLTGFPYRRNATNPKYQGSCSLRTLNFKWIVSSRSESNRLMLTSFVSALPKRAWIV